MRNNHLLVMPIDRYPRDSPIKEVANHSTGYGVSVFAWLTKRSLIISISSRDISSRDCYMLVYALVVPGSSVPQSASDTELSPEVQEHLAEAEPDITNEIRDYSERYVITHSPLILIENVCRLQAAEEEFKVFRKRKQEVYRSWSLRKRNDV